MAVEKPCPAPASSSEHTDQQRWEGGNAAAHVICPECWQSCEIWNRVMYFSCCEIPE